MILVAYAVRRRIPTVKVLQQPDFCIYCAGNFEVMTLKMFEPCFASGNVTRRVLTACQPVACVTKCKVHAANHANCLRLLSQAARNIEAALRVLLQLAMHEKRYVQHYRAAAGWGLSRIQLAHLSRWPRICCEDVCCNSNLACIWHVVTTWSMTAKRWNSSLSRRVFLRKDEHHLPGTSASLR